MNEIKTLLLHLDAAPINRHRLDALWQFARGLGATIESLYAVTPPLMLYPYSAVAGSDAVAQLAACETEVRQAARAAFERECAAAGLTGVAWRETIDEPLRALRRLAWAADAVVLSQHQPQAKVPSGLPPDFAASLLVDTGKPGLVLPYIDFAPDLGQNILVAWKPTPESARALTTALPLLQRARKVHLACWDESDEPGTDPAAPAVQFLQRHGVKATVHHEGPPSRDLGEVLLSRAADLQVDLLVMGCYGHGRAREWALGGVTRTVLQSMTLPVWMVH